VYEPDELHFVGHQTRALRVRKSLT